MNTFSLKRGRGLGTWRVIRRDGIEVVSATCAKCGTTGAIYHSGSSVVTHSINDQGVLTPSLVCPSDSCDWHVMARLEGWKPKK